jgi:hypothetical protein
MNDSTRNTRAAEQILRRTTAVGAREKIRDVLRRSLEEMMECLDDLIVDERVILPADLEVRLDLRLFDRDGPWCMPVELDRKPVHIVYRPRVLFMHDDQNRPDDLAEIMLFDIARQKDQEEGGVG